MTMIGAVGLDIISKLTLVSAFKLSAISGFTVGVPVVLLSPPHAVSPKLAAIIKAK